MSIEEGTPVVQIWKERFGWAVTHYLTFGPLAYATTLAYDRMGLLGLATLQSRRCCSPSRCASTSIALASRLRRCAA